MRPTWLGFFGFGLVACNAIWGNESYTLVDGAAAAGDAGQGGNVAKAGAGTGGHAGRASIAEGGAAGASDEAGSAGAAEAGEGGASGGVGDGPCVPAGAENCFNGKDDDCDGATDCEDSACTATSMCVPDASDDGDLGTLLDTGSSCPTGYSAVTLHRGLMFDPNCQGCTCGVDSLYCTTSIVGHGSYACPGYQTSGVSYNMFDTSCQPISPGTSVHYFSVQSYTSCTGSGTATPSPVQWSETRTYCKATHVGGGCKNGLGCVPKTSSPICAREAGSATCSGAYATSTGAPWNSGFTDDRTCGACQCGGGYGNCDGASIQLFSEVGCGGTSTSLPNTQAGAQGDSCALPFAPVSGKVVGTPVATQCVNNTSPSGTVEEAGPSTVCCQ